MENTISIFSEFLNHPGPGTMSAAKMVADSTQSDPPEKSARKRKKVVEKKKEKRKKLTNKKVRSLRK